MDSHTIIKSNVNSNSLMNFLSVDMTYNMVTYAWQYIYLWIVAICLASQKHDCLIMIISSSLDQNR